MNWKNCSCPSWHHRTGRYKVQRISDYNSFLSRLLLTTDPEHPDYDDLKKALDRVEMMVKDREKQLQNVENEQKMDTVQDRFPNDDLHLQEKDKKSKNPVKRRATAGAVLLKSLSKKHNHQSEKNVPCSSAPSGGDPATIVYNLPTFDSTTKRVYVLESPVQLTAACQSLDRYLFLFNDILLVAKQRSSSVYKLKQRVRVGEIWLAGCISEVAESCRPHDRSIVIGWPTINYVATFGSPELMSIWKEKLTKLIAEEKENEDKTCIIKIRYTAPGGCHASKTLSVTNTEDASSVVNRCIDEFHIQNTDQQEYQLWSVCPGKEDPPYPLFGHEIPYAIRKNHEREWGHRDPGQAEETIDSLRGLDLSYFTLQPAKKKPRDLSLEDPRKGKKVKRSPLHGIFRRNQKTTVLPPSGCLFGRSLDELCDGDKLPEPILVILKVLFVQGQYTVGVFRKPGNHKKCQDVKTKLDNGETVTEDELTVPVAASLFKDFLMSLPNCLLGSQLFDDWLATANLTEASQKEQRINLCKRYVSSLSRGQQTLLRHLMCVLHTIACLQMDKDQGMDAYGLAVCIGQSMLWPSPSNSSSMSDALSKVPLVVQFLIENCEQIFGASSLKLFGKLTQEVKPPQDSSTDSESLHSLPSSLPEQQYVNVRDNSSLDSLERDCYYPEMDSSPQLAKSHLSPTNLSRDSGLTLSDTQLYEDCGDVELSTVTTRKTSYVRSYSQSEDQQPSADPGTLSRSQDADLLHHGGFPVPPPRKPKRRSAGPEFENAMPLQAMRNCGSTGVIGDHKKHYWNAPNPRRISDDSTLGSLDEEYPEDQHTLYLDQYRGGLDIGTLTKSESGAHLYLNDTDLIDHEDDLHQCSPSSHQKSKTSLVLGDHQRRSVLQKLGGSLDLQHTVVTAVKDNVPFGGCKTGISSEGQSSLPSSKALSDLASQNPNNTDSHSSDSTTCSMNNDLSGSGSRSCKANDLPFQKTSFNSVKVLSQDVPSTSQVQPHNKSASSVASMSVERSRRAKLKRSDAIDTTTLRKGMTPSGEDKFPTKIPLRTSLYRLEDDGGATSFRQHNTSGEAKSTEQCSTSSQQACLTRRTPGSCKRSDSCSGLAPAVVRSLQQGAIEKSASDTTISEQFELSGPVRATARRRPSNPPSYEEAIQRQSQLGRKLHLSEQDIAIQQKNSAKAKKLYEESLKKYETSEVPGCCPPHRENQIRDRARDVRCPGNHGDSEQTGGPRQPPPYKQACRRAARQQEQNKHQTLHHQTNSGRCESSQQQHRVDLPSKQCDIGPTGEQSLNTNTELGLRCSPQSVTRYSPSQLGGHAELEQPRVELSAKDQRTAHHPIQDNLSIQHTESINDHRDSRVHQDTARAPRAGSPAPQAGSPAPQAGSSAPQIGSPAPQSSSAGLQNHLPVHYSSSASHHTSSPVHHINSVAHHKGSPIHCASSAVWRRESAEQSRPSRAACQMNSVHATQEGHKSPSSASSQESMRSERTAANSQNNRQKHNTVQPERTQNKQSEICSKPDQVVESSKQSAGREKVSSDNPASHSNSSQDLGSAGQDRSRQVRQEGRRRSSSRSRERRSDPKMSSTKSTLITNLGRSKSDSQDHVDKVNRFKTFRAYENNKENISLEDLQADDVIGDYRHGGDQKASRDHTRSQGEESSQRRVVQNSSVLRTAGDQHQNGNGVKTTRRLSVPSSVRNRDWHKELASQYTETFFQPDKPAEAPSKVIQFGYMSPAGTCPKSADKSRPRWTPPVHPTKDLIYITKDDIHATDARQSRSAAAQAVKRRGCRSKSQERPISLISDDFQKLRQLAHGRTSESQPQNDNLGDVRNKMADVRTADDATPTTADDESGVDWSVARLRKLYVGDKVQKERANLTARANGGSNGHFYTPGSRPPAAMLRRDDRLNEDSGHGKCYTRRRYVNEKTNPDANEDYI